MYEWIKVAHIVSIISWMAGLLYLPRLMVYHSVSAKGSDQSETFKIMERRLLKAIMTPAMILSWIFGLGLAGLLGGGIGLWFILKLALVATLTVFHVFLAKEVNKFAADNNARPQRFFRIINEIPTLLMILIVILVIIKPF